MNKTKIQPIIARKIRTIARLEGMSMEDWLYRFAKQELGTRWDTERAINQLDDDDITAMDARVGERMRDATDDEKMKMLWEALIPVLETFDLDGWIERLKAIKGEQA